MNDLPGKAGNSNNAEDKNPLLATLEAMQRLKTTNLELETRISGLETRTENLEKAFEMAFKNGASSLEEFLHKLDEGAGDEKPEIEKNEAEIIGEDVKGEDEQEEIEEEEEDDSSPSNAS